MSNEEETWIYLPKNIVDSSLWFKSSNATVLWIVMALMADEYGVISASIDMIASRAGMSSNDARKAMDELIATDKYSNCELGSWAKETATGFELSRFPGFSFSGDYDE